MTELDPDLPRAGPPWAERLVRFMDDGITVPGTRFRIGFDGLIGMLFPAAGDGLTTASSLALFWLAFQRNVPRTVLLRMALNVALDAVIGAVPLVGDLFDFGWKANRRNLRLIEQASELPARRKRPGDYLVIGLLGLLIAAAIALPFVLTGLLIAYLWRGRPFP